MIVEDVDNLMFICMDTEWELCTMKQFVSLQLGKERGKSAWKVAININSNT